MNTLIKCVTLLALLCGILITQTYVVGFELHRFYAPSWLFLAVAGLLLFMPNRKTEHGSVWIFISLAVLALYLSVRGIRADVPALTHKEYPVFFYGAVTFLAASAMSRSRVPLLLLSGFSLILLGIQYLYMLTPADESMELLKPWGLAHNQKRMYGFFRHHSPFASMCSLSASFLMGLVFIKPKRVGVNVLWKLLSIILTLLAIYCAYLSKSRLGAGVSVLGGVFALSAGFTLRFLIREGKVVVSFDKLLLAVIVAALGITATVGGVSKMYALVSLERHKTGTLQEDLQGDMRIQGAGMGFSLWMKSPAVGKGPRAFSYYSPSLREGSSLQPWLSDPYMVHNDFIQTLAEYGFIGFFLIILALSLILFFMWRAAWKNRWMDSAWFALPIGASAAVLAICIQSLGDFTMHSTAVFIHLSLILGISYGWSSRVPAYKKVAKPDVAIMVSKTFFLLSASICFLWVGHKHIIHTPLLLKYDEALWEKGESTRLKLSRAVAEKCPDPIALETLGIQLLNSVSNAPVEQRLEHLSEAEQTLEAAYKLHPYRLSITTNLAQVKILLNKLDEAEFYIVESFKWSKERWRAYRLGRLTESYLIKRGEYHWKKRNASLAMSYFLKAKEYNEKGYFQKQVLNADFNRATRQTIEKYLKTLELGRVTPQDNVIFLKQYGL